MAPQDQTERVNNKKGLKKVIQLTRPSRIALTMRSHEGLTDGLMLKRPSSNIRNERERRRDSKDVASAEVDRNLRASSMTRSQAGMDKAYPE